MKLLIVESPTKAKTLTKYLSGFKVIASVGHIIDLPQNKLGVDVENNFEPTYTVIDGKQKVIDDIKKAVNGADEVFIGSDPDREGEAIAYHVASLMKDKEPRRVLFHEITRSGVIKALKEYTEIDMDLFNSQQTRRILDRIVGYRLSPFLWFAIKKGLSAGRVQSVALKLIVDREHEIRRFIPEEYWSAKALFKYKDEFSIEAALDKIDGKKAKIHNGEEAAELERRVKEASSYDISKIEKKKKKETPPPPFNTSLLQQEAARTHHYPTDKIMRIAQSLYEGKEIGEEGPVGLITYMRTDSFRIADEANSKLRDYVKNSFGEKYLATKVRYYKNKKGKTQDAHEAIRPTNVAYTPDNVKGYLTKEEFNIYSLIWRRFVATQMKEAEYQQSNVFIENSERNLLFKKTGTIQLFDGFQKVYKKKSKDEILPAVKENMVMNISKIETEQHFTKPPARFNDSTIVKELEDKGIGRPSTYASIMKHIILKKYVERLKEPRGAFKSTELGELVSDMLQKYFNDIINIGFTAGMEENLDEIAEGKIEWIEVLSSFYNQFSERLEQSFANIKEEGRKVLYAEQPCPKCEAKVRMRWARKTNEPFLSCERFPDCDFSSSFEREGEKINIKITDQDKKLEDVLDEKCPECGSPLVMKTGRYGPFKACSAYPKCKTIINEEIVIADCPKDDCGGKVVQKRSRRGKVFYGCNNYPKCDFVSWYPPLEDKKCDKCGGNYMVEKKKEFECMICKEKTEKK